MQWSWPTNVESGYALAAVALATLAFVVVSIVRFLSQNLMVIEKISSTLDNHLSHVAKILEALVERVETLEEYILYLIEDEQEKSDASHTS